MSHANAALTPRARLRVAQLVVDQGESIPEVAARFQCSYTTVKRWAGRYAAGESMQDRSSRPHPMPAKTPPAVTKRIVSLRLRKRLGPVQLAAHVGVAPSTVHRVLTRCRLNRLAHVDRATGEPVRRYEHPHPGAMLHVDVKKLGNIPDGGGWRYVGPRPRRAEPGRDPGQAQERVPQPEDGHRVRAHRHRRPLPRRLRRDPRRRDRRHRHRRPAQRGRLVRRRGASSSSGCCPTTARPTGRTCGATCARSSGSSTPAPGPTGHRPTARSNASTAPCPTAGATPAATPPRANAATPCQHGSTSTTTTDPTPPAGTSHPSPA